MDTAMDTEMDAAMDTQMDAEMDTEMDTAIAKGQARNDVNTQTERLDCLCRCPSLHLCASVCCQSVD
eukprot:4079708-Pleurochrysis_carterae.AAC.1